MTTTSTESAVSLRLRWELIVWLGFLLMVAFLYRLPLPPTPFWMAVTNCGHVVVFAVGAVALFRMSFGFLGPRLPGLGHYGLALVASFVGGVALEGLQIDGPRDASLDDVWRDLQGAIGGLGLALSFDRAARADRVWLDRGAVPLRMLAILVIALGLLPLASEALRTVQRDSALPTIAAFEAHWETRFQQARDADLMRVPAPQAWTGRRGQVGRVVFRAGEYPTFAIEPAPDWTGSRRLRLAVFNPTEETVELAVRIHDTHYNGRADDRFRGTLAVPPGASDQFVELGTVESAPAHRTLDLTSVASLMFFVVGQDEPVVLYFDDIRLE